MAKKSAKKTAKKSVKKPVSKKVVKKAAQKTKRQPAKKAAPKATRKSIKKTAKKLTKKVKRVASKTAVLMPTVTMLPSKGPQIGEEIPNFSIPSTAGQDFVLKNYQGKKVLLYFYPKDSTPGCTIEAYEFSGLQDQFKSQNVEVFGVSRNSLLSHDKFRDEQSLTIDLLSDPDETACKIFDVIKMKNMYGNRVMGVERSTFLLDEKGRLLKEWRKVKAEGHAKEVLNAVKEIKE
jgi:peroxiredoxin Q/BCP